MNNYFETTLLEAIQKCEGHYINNNKFFTIYPYTTENINGYINNFDLNNKSLLTVGSSCDQIINASLFGCKNITIVDICPFTKFYFYLKVAAIIVLNYNEFLTFFSYKNFTKLNEDNEFIFNLNTFQKLNSTLRLLDYESYLFWEELFSNYPGKTIRRRLFQHDEDTLKILKNTNLYISNEEWFNRTKKYITKIKTKFIISDIKDIELNNYFDNIWLSNIGKYISLEELKYTVHKMYSFLNENGRMLICYLYETNIDTKYKDEWEEIYDLNKVFKTFEEYNLNLINFNGIKNFMFNSVNSHTQNDAILLCKKKR